MQNIDGIYVDITGIVPAEAYGCCIVGRVSLPEALTEIDVKATFSLTGNPDIPGDFVLQLVAGPKFFRPWSEALNGPLDHFPVVLHLNVGELELDETITCNLVSSQVGHQTHVIMARALRTHVDPLEVARTRARLEKAGRL